MPYVDTDITSLARSLLGHFRPPATLESPANAQILPLASAACLCLLTGSIETRLVNIGAIGQALSSLALVADLDDTQGAIPFVTELLVMHMYQGEPVDGAAASEYTTREIVSALGVYHDFCARGVEALVERAREDQAPVLTVNLAAVSELKRRADAALADAAGGEGGPEADAILEAMATIDRLVRAHPHLRADTIPEPQRNHFANLLMGVGMTADALLSV